MSDFLLGFEYTDQRPESGWNPRVCLELGYCFLHIPKSAGNSIAERLEEHPRTSSAPRFYHHKHTKAPALKNILGEEAWRRLFKFSVVRNPWDTMVSSYLWWLRKGETVDHLKHMAREIRALDGFSSFIKSEFGRNLINECPGTHLDWLQIEGNIAVEYFAKFEKLDEDWESICCHLNLPCRPLRVRNSEPGRREYRDYYDDETREIVGRRFQREIALFGYEF